MKHTYIDRFGPTTTRHYFNPGAYLDDMTLQQIHHELLLVNGQAKNSVEHKLLESDDTLEQIRTKFKSMVVGILYKDNNTPIGFLISPIIKQDGLTVVHAGLVVIFENNGTNLIALATAGLAKIIFRKFRRVYTTNISATPRIIENFSRFTVKGWPTQQANQIKPPIRTYTKVAHALVNGYVKKYFHNPESVVFDEKRFVLSSDTDEMGFEKNFHKLPRAASHSVNSFVLTWIDTEKGEDILQVGVFNTWVAFKTWAQVSLYRFFLMFNSGPAYRTQQKADLHSIEADQDSNSIERA
ncbi:hypothetical protein [uncultured Shewanella sp.]|uniref:hypothetical protein n=1 Tax=uncultured Shewanella sp. TaxID=173975 RepID=UPI00261F2F5C|nr:hypothetical protein [uncultured Shewanella sp.]